MKFLHYFFFVCIWLSVASFLFSGIGWILMYGEDSLSEPIFSVNSGIEILIILAFYIAYRLTPLSKPQQLQ